MLCFFSQTAFTIYLHQETFTKKIKLTLEIKKKKFTHAVKSIKQPTYHLQRMKEKQKYTFGKSQI